MAIEIKNASFRYPNGFVALENINLTIHEGEKVAIVGQNGAGKTTCVKMMNGLNQPFEGDVLVDGVSTKSVTVATTARKVGYVFQNPDEQIFNNTARAEIEYMPRYYKLDEKEVKERVDYAVKICDIEKYMDINPYEIPYPIRKFVAIAAVIASRPKYIVLDEPTAGLDPAGRENLMANIRDYHRNKKKTIILVSHSMDEIAQNVDRILVLKSSQVLMSGTPSEVFARGNELLLAGLDVPQVTRVAMALKERGLDIDPAVYTVQALEQQLLALRKGGAVC